MEQPGSREIVQSVIKQFALTCAFDQQDVEQQIILCRDELAEVQAELESEFGMLLSTESTTGLRKSKSTVTTYQMQTSMKWVTRLA